MTSTAPPWETPTDSAADEGRADIKSLGRTGLAEAMRDLGEPAYRAAQLEHWLYGRRAASFAGMSDLPATLRDRLDTAFSLGVPDLVERRVSRLDGTRRYLWRLADGVVVESVGMPGDNRLTACFSTQAGCAMGCRFCATGAGGFVRDLTPGEIVDQVTGVAADFGLRVSNAVAMGQGEPFANYDATISALRLLNSPEGPNIGARHLTVSTCGLLSGIRRFATEPEQFTLAVSLHAARQATRDRLMPALRGQPLARLRSTLVGYVTATGRRPTLEYALIEGVNDGDGDLRALVRFCEGLLCHVNIIPMNPVEGSGLARPRREVPKRFVDTLTASGIEATVRAERGADIDAACGQLSQAHSGDAPA